MPNLTFAPLTPCTLIPYRITMGVPGGIGPAPPGVTIPGGKLADGRKERISCGRIALIGKKPGPFISTRQGGHTRIMDSVIEITQLAPNEKTW
jgi:hypothetical protein